MSHMTKEELREDPVLDWIQHAVDWTQRNIRWVAIGAAAVVVVIVASVLVTRGQRRAEVEGQQLLTAGQSYYLQGNPAAAEAQLQELMDKHGGSQAAKIGRIYLGDALSAQGRVEEALAAYSAAAGSVGDAVLKAAALRGKAAALETLGRLGDASKAYEEASGTQTAFQAEDCLGAARTALQSGDPQRAKSILERAEKIEEPSAKPMITFYLAQANAQIR